MMLNRVSLNTIGLNRIGLNRIGKPSRGSSGRPYIDPEVLASLKAVCICYGKSNDDPDRAVVKNLVDPDNPFVISNAAYTEGSGYADKGSPYYGAFVTDGINDLITSTKTVQEMLGGSNEITVVSLITHISGTGKYNIIGDGGIQVSDYSGQTFMAGTSSSGEKIVELGDKEKLQAVQYTTFDSKLTIGLEDSSYAYYGTFVFNKENVPVDWIHQVIAYFNLDRTLNPDILCNTIKQGITNENHAEFGDKLIDFSGNGRDIQLNNIAWKGDSGIGKYEVDFLDSSIWNSSNSTITSSKIDCKNAISHIMLLYYSVGSKEYPDIPSFKVIKTGADIDYSYIDETGSPKSVRIVDGENVLPASHNTLYSGSGRFCGFGNPGMGNSVTITQIPSHAGALCLDGVDDFGQYVGDLGLKDYTVVVDRAYEEAITNAVPILSSIDFRSDIPFLFEFATDAVRPYSFGVVSVTNEPLDINRLISYQSTYSYNGKAINKGASSDIGNGLTFGKFGSENRQYAKLALWSLLLFPYSMSEFLIERQLKKHKLGTLYPDMIEWRPKVNINVPVVTPPTFSINNGSDIIANGQYIPEGTEITIRVYTATDSSVEGLNEATAKINGVDIELSPSGNKTYYVGKFIVSSKQKINITIDEYIRYEDIVQPYPVLLRFNDENGNEVSWGGKFRVGSTITRISSIDDTENNLLNGLYSTNGLTLNGKAVTGSTSIVEKQMVFKTTATYLLDDNEPKVILSPSRLRMPNSSYKILGHIPDISGHGNHGKINNSAYAGISGANGYKYDWNTWSIVGGSNVERTDSLFTNKLAITTPTWGLLPPRNTVTDTFKIKVEGLKTGNIYWTYRESEETYKQFYIYNDGEYELPAPISESDGTGFIFNRGTNAGVIVRQIGQYEGSFCLDGVEDYLTIPTLSHGAKQVLMKVRSFKPVCTIYEQRTPTGVDGGWIPTFCIFMNNQAIAYADGNNGNTYIDGILNTSIQGRQLVDITHNITVANENTKFGNTQSPLIGKLATSNTTYAQMVLYDFMLFDDISTNDKIKELNEYVGIEGNTDDLFNETN